MGTTPGQEQLVATLAQVQHLLDGHVAQWQQGLQHAVDAWAAQWQRELETSLARCAEQLQRELQARIDGYVQQLQQAVPVSAEAWRDVVASLQRLPTDVDVRVEVAARGTTAPEAPPDDEPQRATGEPERQLNQGE